MINSPESITEFTSRSTESASNEDLAGQVIVDNQAVAVAAWAAVPVRLRADSFNQSELMDSVHAHIAAGRRRLVLDLRSNRFLSTRVIRFCAETAEVLSKEEGAFVLIGCSERMKRHFEAYGSLKHIRFIRSATELGADAQQAIRTRG